MSPNAFSYPKQPNSWTCVPTAFSIATGIPLQEIFDRVGHDGSEIVWPKLPEPLCRRSFCVQEVAQALRPDWACSPIHEVIRVGPDLEHLTEIKLNLDCKITRGVIMGQGTKHRHAVAYIDGKIIDPKGAIYVLPSALFVPDEWYALDLISRI